MHNVKPLAGSGFELLALEADAPAVEDYPCRSAQLRDLFQLISPADLSALIGVDERTLATWRTGPKRKGPDFVKLGRAVFYRRADVTAWIDLNITPTDRAA
jgi:predicted DNA-binding transcriptional regulator AlpA